MQEVKSFTVQEDRSLVGRIVLRAEAAPMWLPLLLGAVLRCCMIPFLNIKTPTFWEYGTLAHNMLAGNGFAFDWYDKVSGQFLAFPSAFMPPGHVFLIYGATSLLGWDVPAFLLLFLIELIFALVFVYATGALCSRLFGERYRMIGVWLTAIYPMFVFAMSSFGILNVTLMLDALFIIAAFDLSKALRERTSYVKASLRCGFVGGAMSLFRSESPALIVITLLFLCYWHRSQLATTLKATGIAFVVMSALLVPWLVRNHAVMHAWIPSSSSGPVNFWRGHHAEATGSGFYEDGSSIWPRQAAWDKIVPTGTPDSSIELKFAEYHSQVAKDWIMTHPWIEIGRTFKKFILLWIVDWYYPHATDLPYLGLYLITLGFLIMGVRAFRKQPHSIEMRDGARLVALWTAGYTAVAVSFFVLSRFQIILEGIYFPFVVFGVASLLPTTKKRASKENTEPYVKAAQVYA